MGTEYFIACTECKEVRDLDKFYENGGGVENREDALSFSADIQMNDGTAFRSALLVSFLAKHYGHMCIFFNEHSHDDIQEQYRPDEDFWNEEEQ